MAFDKRLMDILACPLCKGALTLHAEQQELWCKVDKLAYPIRNDIPVLLSDEARNLSADEVVS
ncbi:Trm112 family protein [Gallaecimonas sp. GXIMD1310]|uniref:Trm112 family protein n=1 Tax=Gallaecimonas sp. GXIMD1310 TaxID=3131926 RepID=UPI0032519229